MTSEPSTDPLLERWQQGGDPRALDELLRRELPRLHARLERDGRGLAGPSVSATDAVQEAARKLVEGGETLSFESPARLRAFLWTSARNFLLDRLRRRRRKRLLEEPQLLAQAPAEEGSEEATCEVLAALRTLEFAQREVLELAYLHGLDLAALGRELGISADAARMRLARARERLREACEARRRAGGR